jgi:hypothetical protein
MNKWLARTPLAVMAHLGWVGRLERAMTTPF